MFLECCLTLGNVLGLLLDSRPKVCGNFQAGAREGRCARHFLSSKRIKTQQDQFRCRVTPGPGGRIAWVEGDYKEDRWVTLHGWMVLGGWSLTL